MRRRCATWTVLLALAATACVPRPVVELDSARITSATPYGVGMTMLLRVNNANPFDVRVRNVRVQVTIADKYPLPYVRFDPEQWLPAHSWSYVSVPTTIPWPTIRPLLDTTLRNDAIAYHVSGYVDVTATRLLGLQVNDHEIDQDATVSRTDLLAAAFRGVLPGTQGTPPPGSGARR